MSTILTLYTVNSQRLSQMRCPQLSMPHALLIAEQSQHAWVVQCDEPPLGLNAPAGRTTMQGGFCGEETATTVTRRLFHKTNTTLISTDAIVQKFNAV